MAHTPYGYKIVGGKAVIDKVKAKRIIKLFDEYIAGAAIMTASKVSGIVATHSVAGRMLKNEKYLGTDFYPAIIDKERFEAAAAERHKRAKALGRLYEYPDETETKEKKYVFTLKNVPQKYENPFRQAEYAYSLIESEEACE